MSRKRLRKIGSWGVAAGITTAVAVRFALERTYGAGGVALTVAGLAVAGAVAVSAWPKTTEPTISLAIAGLALAAIGTGAGVGFHSGKHHSAAAPNPPPQKLPASLPSSGSTLRIFNEVTSGAHAMRNDN